MAEQKEKWIQWVALTTTILAVSAAISSLKGGELLDPGPAQEHAGGEPLGLLPGEEPEAEPGRAGAGAAWPCWRSRPARRRGAARPRRRSHRATGEAQRYEEEKREIKAEAEKLAAEQAELKRHGGSFGLAVMLLQIAIMMSSVGALIKKPVMWYVGLLFGVGGLGYMANGLWGWF